MLLVFVYYYVYNDVMLLFIVFLSFYKFVMSIVFFATPAVLFPTCFYNVVKLLSIVFTDVVKLLMSALFYYTCATY